MGLLDIILFPFYVLLFHLFFSARRRKIDDPLLRKYHAHGFWIKVFSCVAFTFFNVYLSIGDSLVLYFDEGVNLKNLVFKDFSHIQWFFLPGEEFDQNLLFNSLNRGYFASAANFFIVRSVGILSFVTFSSYMVINLFFSMLAFSGVWRLYRFFYGLYPHLHKRLAIAIIYFPTFVFWSSGILKDPVCAAMMGYLSLALYNLIINKRSVLKNMLVAVTAAYVLGVVKSYILVSYLPFLLLFILLLKLKSLQRLGAKIALVSGLIIFSVIGVVAVADRLQEEMGSLAFDKITESVKKTQSNFINMADLAESSFSLGVEFDGSTGSLIKMAPLAINATLFRPYIWESKKVSTLLSSLESLALMLLTLYVIWRAGPFRFIGSLLRDPAILFCFFFSILFALFVGATTLNFGTLVRYKIPCMPFYVIALFLVLERVRLIQQKKALDKQRPSDQ